MGNGVGLFFTRVLDEIRLGLVDEDEEAAEVTDRAYWERRGSKETMKLVDEMLQLVREYEPTVELNYNKFYIGMTLDGRANNRIIFLPRKKNSLVTAIRLDRTDEVDQVISDADFDTLEYQMRQGRYRFRIDKEDLQEKRDALKTLIRMAFAKE